MALSTKHGFKKVEGLLQIMHIISTSEEKYFIVNDDETEIQTTEADCLIDVLKFLKENIQEQISLEQVASIACMQKQSFCRFFKRRTKKTLSQYLEELRMEHAKKLLIERKEQSISEIAFACGYTTSSHFCKIFKDYNNQSPFQYKRNIRKGLIA